LLIDLEALWTKFIPKDYTRNVRVPGLASNLTWL